MDNLRPEVQAVREVWSRPTAPIGEDIIEVSTATRRIAGAYERFRNTLEPEEEDFLRRSAIARTLERRLKQNRSDALTAMALVQELIRANYTKPLPRQVLIPVAQDVASTRFVIDRLEPYYHDWFLRLAAVSIDHRLHRHERQEALVRLMYQDTFQRVSWMGNIVEEDQQTAQLFIACYRVLFAADDAEIMYTYFVSQFPAWEKPETTEPELTHIAVHLPAFHATANTLIDHPARHRLMRALRPVAVPYRVIYDLLQRAGSTAWESVPSLETATQRAVAERKDAIRVRMRRRAWHSVLFLLFTKTILTGLLEFPYELFILRNIHWLALGVNTIFHPLLLLVTSALVDLPGVSNTQKIVDQVRRIITADGELPTIVLAPHRHYGPITWSGFAVLYTILFVVIFWALFSLLDLLGFSLVGMLLFVIFLGLVVFLAFRVRRAVDEVRVEAEREGFFSTLFSFIGLPILEFGRWLARNIRQLNVLLFLMDRVLEAPFKLLIDVIEDWFSFVRDRKEEIG